MCKHNVIQFVTFNVIKFVTHATPAFSFRVVFQKEYLSYLDKITKSQKCLQFQATSTFTPTENRV
jgi:hypothetical protein